MTGGASLSSQVPSDVVGLVGTLVPALGLEASWASGWPGASAWGTFVLAVALLNATPGVDLLLTVSRSLQAGARAGMSTALGIVLGCGVHALAAALGLAALMAVHAGALQAVQWLGAAYLAWLGLGMLRSALRSAQGHAGGDAQADPPCEAPDEPVTAGLARELRTGLLTNLLNPKVALFFMAFLPQFVPAGAPHPTAVMLALGAVFMLQSFLFLALLVALTVRMGGWAARLQGSGRAGRGRARAGALLQAAGGLLFLGLAARLAGGDLSVATAPVGGSAR